jgi:hypothetical protein
MTLDRDDELLTALSQGVRPDPDDPMAELLADWHADLDSDLPPVPTIKRRRWWSRPIATGLAAGVLVLGGVTGAAATAQPGSPLWPITQAVYPHRAQGRSAEQAATRLLDQAAAAINDRRYKDAVTSLTDASGQINLVTDTKARGRLLQRWVDLRALLLSLSPGTPTVAPTEATGPRPSAAPKPTTSPGRSGGGGLQPLPLPSEPIPLPSKPLPLPSLPLPLPSLPLPPLLG